MGEGKGIGLVLAGGGGKGAYQVGVLKVLQEQGLLEDVTAISGASIGAVNAMLYSMNDMERMYQAWNEIDMDTVFDIDLNMLAEKRMYFSRNEMLAMFEKYIDMEKIKADFRDIYVSISRLNETQQPEQVEYRRLEDYDADTIRKILLASTALPVMYEAVEIDGKKYRDGGLLDTTPSPSLPMTRPMGPLRFRSYMVVPPISAHTNHSPSFFSSSMVLAGFVTFATGV